MRAVKLRVFITRDGEGRQDHVVELPGETPVAEVREAAHAALARRLAGQFKVTGVNLYPHWKREEHGDER